MTKKEGIIHTQYTLSDNTLIIVDYNEYGMCEFSREAVEALLERVDKGIEFIQKVKAIYNKEEFPEDLEMEIGGLLDNV